MRRRRRGFALLEVMIALAFIGIAMVAVIRTQAQGIKLAEEARFMTRAVFMARHILAVTQAETDLGPGVSDGHFEEPLDNILWEREVGAVPGLPGIFRITVWVHREGEPARQGLNLVGFAYGDSGDTES